VSQLQESAATVGCGFVELVGRGKSLVTGADAVSILHKFCTNDVLNLPVDRGCEAFVLDSKGQIQFFALIHLRADGLFVELPADPTVPGVAAGFAKFVGRYVIVEKVQFHDQTSQIAELFIAGSDAEALVAAAFEITLPASALDAVDCRKLGEGAWLARAAQAEVPNFTLFAEPAACETAKFLLSAAGATARDSAWYDALRIAAKFPLLGRDVLEKALPQEIDRNARTLNFRKGCYLGQETVARLDAMGHVNKALTVFNLEPTATPPTDLSFAPGAGPELRVGEQVVGRLTSVAQTTSGTLAALGLVKTSHRTVGTRLESTLGPCVVTVPAAK
jgi:folate-binding protein YgfZ